MKLRTSLFAAVALAILPVADHEAAAQSLPGGTVYDVVTAYEAAQYTLYVTGVVHGDSASSTKGFNVQTDGNMSSCERMLLVSMNRPGRFRVMLNDSAYPARCMLTAVP